LRELGIVAIKLIAIHGGKQQTRNLRLGALLRNKIPNYRR